MFNICDVDYAIGIFFMFKKVSNTKLKMKCPIIFADKFISFNPFLSMRHDYLIYKSIPDSTVHGANMGPTWVLLGPMLAPWTLLSGMPLVQHLAKAATWHSTIALDNQGQCVIWLTDDYTCHVMPYVAPFCPRQLSNNFNSLYTWY